MWLQNLRSWNAGEKLIFILYLSKHPPMVRTKHEGTLLGHSQLYPTHLLLLLSLLLRDTRHSWRWKCHAGYRMLKHKFMKDLFVSLFFQVQKIQEYFMKSKSSSVPLLAGNQLSFICIFLEIFYMFMYVFSFSQIVARSLAAFTEQWRSQTQGIMYNWKGPLILIL